MTEYLYDKDLSSKTVCTKMRVRLEYTYQNEGDPTSEPITYVDEFELDPKSVGGQNFRSLTIITKDGLAKKLIPGDTFFLMYGRVIPGEPPVDLDALVSELSPLFGPE